MPTGSAVVVRVARVDLCTLLTGQGLCGRHVRYCANGARSWRPTCALWHDAWAACAKQLANEHVDEAAMPCAGVMTCHCRQWLRDCRASVTIKD